MDATRWQSRLDDLARAHHVPGASLAVLAGGEVTAVATGVLHTGTGVSVTTDSLFQIGSATKVYTATVLMRLIEQGLATVDTTLQWRRRFPDGRTYLHDGSRVAAKAGTGEPAAAR